MQTELFGMDRGEIGTTLLFLIGSIKEILVGTPPSLQLSDLKTQGCPGCPV